MRARYVLTLLAATVLIAGCNSLRRSAGLAGDIRPDRPADGIDALAQAESPFRADRQTSADAVRHRNTRGHATGRMNAVAAETPAGLQRSSERQIESVESDNDLILPAGFSDVPTGGSADVPTRTATLQMDGRTYEVRLIERPEPGARFVSTAGSVTRLSASELPAAVPPADAAKTGILPHESREDVTHLPAPQDAQILNLPTVLSMVGGDHPAVASARWRIQEAYADLDRAEAMWLPSIRAGISFHRHDGSYQASNGDIVDVNRNSTQFGFGTGATGAGTTPRPGLQAQFHLADALFEPEIARRNAWSAGHAERAILNRQLRDAAVAYVRLVEAWQTLEVLRSVRQSVAELSDLTRNFAEAGQGLQADADRLNTELALLDSRIASAAETAESAAADLRYAVSTDDHRTIIPGDLTLLPLEMIPADSIPGELISRGLSNRPELKELQALVAAACEEYRRQKYAPLVPSVMLGFSAGGFSGGRGDDPGSPGGRYDLDAGLSWEIRNLGFGERAARRRAEAKLQQTMFSKVRRIDDVAREITRAHSAVQHRSERMASTQQSITSARESYRRNLERIRDGAGLPLEALQSAQALETAQRSYVEAVADYNAAQFELMWAAGWPVAVQ